MLRLHDATAACKFTRHGFSIALVFGEKEEKNQWHLSWLQPDGPGSVTPQQPWMGLAPATQFTSSLDPHQS